MADRDLQGRSGALAHVLTTLQRDVRTLRSRAGRPGAIRSDDKDPMTPHLASLTDNSPVTLNELHLDPGQWVLLARGQASVDAALFTGREMVNAGITVIPPTGSPVVLATNSYSPMCTPAVSATGPIFATSWSTWGVHSSEEQFTVRHQAYAGDWSSVVHWITWDRGHLLALPM